MSLTKENLNEIRKALSDAKAKMDIETWEKATYETRIRKTLGMFENVTEDFIAAMIFFGMQTKQNTKHDKFTIFPSAIINNKAGGNKLLLRYLLYENTKEHNMSVFVPSLSHDHIDT